MYEARMFHNDRPQDKVYTADTIEQIRIDIEAHRFIPFTPTLGDPPTLIETWL